ncbi:olfactory receptor 11L1-like [Bufo gargarizans]|uniref:olfactory receptor 11L1-like n=1 Tax=Bufo gargarizans TaxID=30331 RepID=UPI001CF112D0|nr:olfactory receptor 11L1-like [Bufo gargarizans]
MVKGMQKKAEATKMMSFFQSASNSKDGARTIQSEDDAGTKERSLTSAANPDYQTPQGSPRSCTPSGSPSTRSVSSPNTATDRLNNRKQLANTGTAITETSMRATSGHLDINKPGPNSKTGEDHLETVHIGDYTTTRTAPTNQLESAQFEHENLSMKVSVSVSPVKESYPSQLVEDAANIHAERTTHKIRDKVVPRGNITAKGSICAVLNFFVLLGCKGNCFMELKGPEAQYERLTDGNGCKMESNQTWVTEVLLLGFQNLQGFRMVFFVLLILIYGLTICGNLLIITLVSYSKSFQTPMYYFLVELSISDLMLTTTIVPNTLYIILNKQQVMYFINCFIQFFFFGVSECSECLHLTVMSYDRYLAICSPLRYSTLMEPGFCQKLVSLSWLLSLSVMLTEVISIRMLKFCGYNIIDHFFCDLFPLLDLSCSNTSMVQTEIILLSIPVLVLPFVFIIITYIFIISSILNISTNTGRQKAFSTCSSHLTVVSLFYGTLFSSYVLPTRGKSVNVSKILPLLYTVMTPLINPMIYSLRNEEMKTALHNFATYILASFRVG